MASKKFLLSLEKDQILISKVEEVFSDSMEILCNFQGELLLVANKAGVHFEKGDPIKLQVLSTNPLQFRIFNSHQGKFQRVV